MARRREIAQGLDKLKQQLQQAQQAMNDQQPGQRNSGPKSGQTDQSAALDTIARLRNQIDSMTRAPGRNAGDDRANKTRKAASRQAKEMVPVLKANSRHKPDKTINN